MAESLHARLNPIGKREDHLFTPHLSEYSIKEIKQPENHHTLLIEVDGGIKVITHHAHISRAVF